MIRSVSLHLCCLSIALAVFVTDTFAQESAPQELVQKAMRTVLALRAHSEFSHFIALSEDAKALVVIPEFIEAAVLVGGAGGTAVLLARDENTGEWSYPAFYDVNMASVGLQAGGSISQVMLVFRTSEALERLISLRTKLGVERNIVIGRRGERTEVGWLGNVGTDFFSFALARGVFIGAALEGAMFTPKHRWNHEYYDDNSLTPRDIIERAAAENAGADGLRHALDRRGDDTRPEEQ